MKRVLCANDRFRMRFQWSQTPPLPVRVDAIQIQVSFTSADRPEPSGEFIAFTQ
jgi:hypothetical protein